MFLKNKQPDVNEYNFVLHNRVASKIVIHRAAAGNPPSFFTSHLAQIPRDKPVKPSKFHGRKGNLNWNNKSLMPR